MAKFNFDDLFDAASMVEEHYQINIQKDIIFSNELNLYFNYSLNKDEKIITFTTEVDEGCAKFFVKDFYDENNQFEISCNQTAQRYLSRINLDPIEGIPRY